jgi:environmental stress-induced protein Ves/uncharacterized cupin superfamily protein
VGAPDRASLRLVSPSRRPDPFIVFAPDVAEVPGHYPAPFDAERVGCWQNLGKAAGSASLGFGIDRLAPGERSSFTHAHALEEELVYVLEGECSVRLVEPGQPMREVPLRAGHVVSFVAGTGIAHSFVNRGTRDCRLFTVGERRANERSFYAEDTDYDAFFARERPERHWAEGLALPIRHLTPDDYRVMPWRNGLGTTTELAIGPEGAGLEGGRFLYRVSIADVASDGPFSRFPGYDRHIMLLVGEGMTVDGGAHGRIALEAPFVAHSFDGDWDVTGTLGAGPVRDLNLIVDRERASSSLEVRVLERAEPLACEPGDICIVHVLEGDLATAAAGDTLVVPRSFTLVPRGTARVAVARVQPRRSDVTPCHSDKG